MSRQTLVEITPNSHGVILELAYATPNNFTGRVVYRNPLCYLHTKAVEGLLRAVELLQPLGLTIKIWDGFRPQNAQRVLFEAFGDPRYISPPDSGPRPHCRGIAIDMTLVDSSGNELSMGTEFDEFRPLAHHGNCQITEEAQRNRFLLAGVMNVAGFVPHPLEWWHYQLPAMEQFPVLPSSCPEAIEIMQK